MNAPIIYIAHPVTGEFIGNGFADPDPLDTENWLVPAYAYLDAPPTAGAGEVVVRSADQWVLRSDYRGVVYDTLTGLASDWRVIGDLPDDLTDQSRPSPAHRWTGSAWELDQGLAAEQDRKRINTESLIYLAETDWYVIRNQETGIPVPADVLERRAAARVSVNR